MSGEAPSHNVYDDETRASAYSELGFRGTYYLAVRDMPEILDRHVAGKRALDFGCGAGRSTRFLRSLGFEVIGVDISSRMLEQARRIDSKGDYRLIPDGDLGGLEPKRFDLIQSMYAFDAIPSLEHKVRIFSGLRELLAPEGRIVVIVTTRETYLNDWLSFSTDFPENATARTGDPVRIVVKDMPDHRPVVDILCEDADYREVFERAGLELIETYWPQGNDSDPYEWVSEMDIPPWAIHVMARAG